MVEISANEYPLLSTISSPADLRRLPVESLEALCAELRRFLIERLSVNPGHFASSMGAVELTVALHYVFDTPYDRLVWDVGHQAYVHKLLTGRARVFDTNRCLGGLSGFPNPDESEYDTFSAGHASNSISAALGMSVASALKQEGKTRHAVAVIGDASISGGLAFEGLNNAASSASNLLIVLNDNDMSIDENVGSLNRYLTHLNTSPTYNNLRYKLYRLLKKLHLLKESTRRSLLRFNNSLKSLLSRRQNIFEGLDIRYFGPFDGHDVVKLVRVLTDIRDIRGPKMLHLRTVKGKGYAPAEADPSTWHAPGRFDAATGERPAGGGSLKFQDVFGNELLRLAQGDPRIVAITAAMPSGTSVSTMQQALPQRTFDVGISEGHAVTFAGGLAREGLRPFVAIYSSFMQRGYDHIIHDVALQRLPVTFCLDRAGIVGEDGATHHGLFDIAYLRSIPGMKIAAPRSAQMLERLMQLAASRPAHEGPMAIRYPRGTAPVEEAGALPEIVSFGKAQCLAQGADAAILAIGPLALRALEVSRRLHSERGIEAAVYDMIFVKPLDTGLLAALAAKGTPIVTVEDGMVAGGMGSAVAEELARLGAANPVKMLGVADTFIPQGTPAQLHELAGLDAGSIADAVVQITTKPDTRS